MSLLNGRLIVVYFTRSVQFNSVDTEILLGRYIDYLLYFRVPVLSTRFFDIPQYLSPPPLLLQEFHVTVPSVYLTYPFIQYGFDDVTNG